MTSLPHGYRALVIGASGGIGSAVASVLEADPACGAVLRLSRRADGLDVTREESVAAAAERLDGEFHLIFSATGGLTIDGVGPEKSLRQISADAMMKQFALNALGTALVTKHFAPKLSRKERALMAFLSARVGSIGDNHLGGWISYRASKAALNQIVRTASIELSRSHPQAVLLALHPGTVATTLSEKYSGNHARTEPADSAKAMLSVLDGRDAGQTGHFYAYDGQPIEW
ncbi:SDR family NAD(P)-dependent oxidoreductase [Rhizobium sp. CSW-27]|uniref:SDR family NAD(P)-dependent oxidoreductase n=1 Tax=Rhizobium sp. CSW-27 TaxID=2839985 RepID=UPI001C02B376|nr:SDR family NAD(P)-dependent oxidoreductase [Rhizobium sp. CSW-27]MBT9369512.1 SDR family NAD(P)-dependent oxidoreductase [Rhizobium sp. CSW-27]